jgi:signal peptide peptidase SppA
MIRYPHIYRALHFEPWAIQASMLSSMIAVLNSRLGQTAFTDVRIDDSKPMPQLDAGQIQFLAGGGANAADPQHEIFAAAEYVKSGSPFAPAFIEDGVAIISVTGILAKGMSGFEKSCYGGVGPEDVARSLRAVKDREDVRGIILNVDSPGGYIHGIPELGDLVAQIQRSGKKIVAFTDGQMCSAAYWMAAGASAIYSARLADVGSIGVYCVALDWSKFYEKAGVSVNVIRDGKFKGEGVPGTEVTDEMIGRLQADVKEIGAAFRSHVTAFRRLVKQDSMEGQSFSGQKAAAVGLVDGILPDLTAVKAKMDSAR